MRRLPRPFSKTACRWESSTMWPACVGTGPEGYGEKNAMNVHAVRVCSAVLAASLALAGAAASAQDTTRPLRIVQGFAPGGGHDTVARLLAPRVGTELKLQAIVEGR